MREIKFRGYNKMKGWIYGNYISADRMISEVRIESNQDYVTYIVNKDSIGQYTGFKDKNGVEIYEGDIVNYGITNHIVVWNKESASFGLTFDEIIIPFIINKNYGMHEVIGNTYEEKLKESK